jgi:hypothetical protein
LISNGDPGIFLQSGIAVTILAVIAAVVGWSVVRFLWQSTPEPEEPEVKESVKSR